MTKYYKRYIFIVSFLHSLISRAKAIKSVNSKHVKDYWSHDSKLFLFTIRVKTGV